MDPAFENLWPEQESVQLQNFDEGIITLKNLHLNATSNIYEILFNDGSFEKIEAATVHEAISKAGSKSIKKIRHLIPESQFTFAPSALT